jgi:hypothetical protein
MNNTAHESDLPQHLGQREIVLHVSRFRIKWSRDGTLTNQMSLFCLCLSGSL